MTAIKKAYREYLPYAALLIAVFAAYANVYGNAFLLDDFVLIVQNRLLLNWKDLPELLTNLSLHGTDLPGGFFRPVQELLFFFIYQIFGMSPVAFHFVNVLLQAITGCLVYKLGRALGMKLWPAFAAALIWSVHPLFTESVDYISGSADMLYASFIIAALLVLLPDFAPRKCWLAGIFFILALGSKESAVVFPALAVVTLFLVSKQRLEPRLYIRTWPLWLILALYLAAWEFVPEASRFAMADQNSPPLLIRLPTSLATLPAYLGLIIWPAGLHMERSFPIFTSFMSWQVLAGIAIVVVAALPLVLGRGKRYLAASWGLLWFAAAFSTYANIIKPVNAIFMEHWMYLPGIGLALGFAQAIAQLKSKEVRKAAAGLAMVIAVILGGVTLTQNRVWHDQVVFYEHIFSCGENSGRAHSSLAQYYFNIGDYDKAEEQYLLTLQHPAPLRYEEMSNIHMHLGFVYLGARPNQYGVIADAEVESVMRLSPRRDQAIEEFEKTVAINPNYYWAHRFLAILYDYEGDHQKAVFHAQRADFIQRSGQDTQRIL